MGFARRKERNLLINKLSALNNWLLSQQAAAIAYLTEDISSLSDEQGAGASQRDLSPLYINVLFVCGCVFNACVYTVGSRMIGALNQN